jgi:tetratricopeptide (TPR) repeat protein
MSRAAAFVLTLLVAQSSAAQVVVTSGFGFSFGGPRARVTGFVTGRPLAAPCFGPSFRPWQPYASAPLIVIVPQPVFVVPANYDMQGFAERFAERNTEPVPRPNPARWHVVRPVNAPPFPPVPRPELNPLAPVAALADRLPDANRESARQVKLAQAAFGVGEFGRAIERLVEASRLTPDEPLPYFLMVQVRMARGEYAEAVAAIQNGLKLAPDWPASRFTPKPLYTADPGAFDRHLAELKDAVERDPNNVTTRFLLAYQLWFTGERDVATKHFQHLAPRVKDKAMVEAFLNVAVGRLVHR